MSVFLRSSLTSATGSSFAGLQPTGLLTTKGLSARAALLRLCFSNAFTRSSCEKMMAPSSPVISPRAWFVPKGFLAMRTTSYGSLVPESTGNLLQHSLFFLRTSFLKALDASGNRSGGARLTVSSCVETSSSHHFWACKKLSLSC